MNGSIRSDVSHPDIDSLIRTELAPQVEAIDHGQYPADFLRHLGALGGFSAALPEAGSESDLAAQANLIARVARTCGATSFLVWCQAACVWYLQQTQNAAARARYLEPVAHGTLLAGTGMSNTVKHLAGIERISLLARREGNGYRVDGALPWVSNLGDGHLLIAAAELSEGSYIMFTVAPGNPGMTLRTCPTFSGMEGTGTFGVHLKGVHIAPEDLLADPSAFGAYLQRIKPGFLLTQSGMGLGLVQASIESIQASNQRLAHVNRYLDDQGDTLQRALDKLQAAVARLSGQGGTALLLDILRVRAQASELCLRAAQSAALHTGAAGYLLSSPAQRRLREALFVAIVTPALKHLRKEIDQIERAQSSHDGAIPSPLDDRTVHAA